MADESALQTAPKEVKQPVDPRPTDLEVFFMTLPHALAGYASKPAADVHSILGGAFDLTRKTVGQCCAMGIARSVTRCSDGSFLGAATNVAQIAGVQPPLAQGQVPGQGMMTNQYPTAQHYAAVQQQPAMGGGQPAPGGMVAQYPTQNQAPAVYGGGGGAPLGQQVNGNRFQAAVIGMYGPDGQPIQPPAQGQGVMTPHGMVPVAQVPQQAAPQGFPQQQPQQQPFAPQPFPQQQQPFAPTPFPQQGQGFVPQQPFAQPAFAPQVAPPAPGFPQPLPPQPRIG